MAKAKLRSVNTHFWTDGYIIKLDPTEKLLFLYLLTNPLANIAGCYEISVEQIAFNTGIEAEKVGQILAKFETAKKVVYRDGWILLVNFVKHQNLNENMRKGVDTLLSVAPEWVKKPFETLSNGYQTLSNGLVKYESEREVESEHKQKAETESVLPLTNFLDLLKEYLGVVQLPMESDWLTVIDFCEVNGYSDGLALDCYKFLEGQSWRDGPISPKTLTNNLPKFAKETATPKAKFDIDFSAIYTQ